VPYYEHREIGYNFRLSNICAGIGRGQLQGLDEKLRARRRIREAYIAALKDCPVSFITDPDCARSNCWLSVMLLGAQSHTEAEDIISALDENDIEARRTWKPMHEQPVFKGCGYAAHDGTGSVSSDLFCRGVCLPSGDGLSAGELELITGVVKSCLEVGPRAGRP
jgi:dTDP-4-amino-4,6-dideoxygalactose transaminase